MAMEIYSIDSVVSDDPQQGRSTEYQPFYSFHHFNDPGEDPTFWYSSRRASQKPEDPGSEVFITLVDLGFNPHVPATNILTVHTTCTNRDLPARLPWGGSEGDLEAEGAVPLSHVRCLTKPTPTMRPSMGRGTQWRLISHLSLNHLSLVGNGGDGSPEALREILFLYDLMDSSATRRQIRGLKGVKSKPRCARRARASGRVLCAALKRRSSSTKSNTWAADFSCLPACWKDFWGCMPQ